MLNKLDLDKVYQGQTEADGEDYQARSLPCLSACPTERAPSLRWESAAERRPLMAAGARVGELLANDGGWGEIRTARGKRLALS